MQNYWINSDQTYFYQEFNKPIVEEKFYIKKEEEKTPIDLFISYLKSSTKKMEDTRKVLRKKYPNFF